MMAAPITSHLSCKLEPRASMRKVASHLWKLLAALPFCKLMLLSKVILFGDHKWTTEQGS